MSIKNIKNFKHDLMYILKQERLIEEIKMKIPLKKKILLPQLKITAKITMENVYDLSSNPNLDPTFTVENFDFSND